MKNKINTIIIMAALALFAVACGNSSEEVNKEPSFTIDAKIDTLDYKMAYLTHYEEGDFVKLDSVAIDSGKFSFSGKVDFPTVHYILFDDSDERLTVFVENSNITVTGSSLRNEDMDVAGSSVHSQIKDFNEKLDGINEKLRAIANDYYAAEESGDTVLLAELDAKYANEDSLKVLFIEDYINENLNSVIAPYLSLRYMMNKEVEELEALNKSFSDSIRKSEYVVKVEERIAIIKSTAIGQPAPAFTMNDRDGNPVALESLKGSYVLIDFWASWCGPCRRENPNVVAAYEKYHHQGFEILGVSFDTDKDKWLQAIEDDKLVWFHVSDLKGWENAAGKLYGIRSIPHSILLDKEGIIVAKNLREEALHEKLAEIFEANS